MVNIIIILLAAIGVLIRICTILPSPPIYNVDQTHRVLLDEPTVYPWARNHIRPLDVIPDPSKETSIFWHIPKSGGTAVKTLYECLGTTLANQVGVDPKFNYQDKNEVIAFHPWPGISRASYVNVDTSSKPGLNRARKMGLVPSGLVDLIITSEVSHAVENLFDESHKGHILALFRHPVDRLVSKFFYLREATWEPQYRPQWKNINILEFAKNKNRENNYVVKKLTGLRVNDMATEEDLRIAMRTIKMRFVVGLLDEMEESVRRFNVVMGIDETDKENRECINHLVHDSIGAKNYNSDARLHKVEPGSTVWNAFARRNELDIKLYLFIVDVFGQQKEIIDSYESSIH